MPLDFPHLDDEGKPFTVTYYTVPEAAKRLHVTHVTLREQLRRGTWPHLKISGRSYLNDAMLARIVEMLTVDPDEISVAWREGGGLGIVADPDEAEGGVS